MSKDGLETQICVTCEKEFLSEVVEPIPVCSDCRLEEQVTALHGDEDEADKTQTRRVQLKKAPAAVKAPIAKKPQKQRDATPPVNLATIALKSVPVRSPKTDQSPSQAPSPTSSRSVDAAEWQVRKADGQVFGPFSEAQVSRWASEGRILSGEEVSLKTNKGQGQWQLIRETRPFDIFFPAQRLEIPAPSAARPEAKSKRFPDNLPFNLAKAEVPLTLDPPTGKDRWRFNLPGETSALFGSARRRWRFDFHRAAYLSAALVCTLLLFFLIFKINWSQTSRDMKDWWRLRNRVPDQIDKYIETFKAELPPSGNPPLTTIELEKQAFLLLDQETLGAVAQAEKLFKRALVQDPDSVPALAGLAETLAEEAFHTQNTQQSLVAYDFAMKAVKLDPDGALANRAFAHFHIRQGNKQEGITYLQKALAKNPQDWRAIALEGEWNLLHVADRLAGRINLEKISSDGVSDPARIDGYFTAAIEKLRQALTLNAALGSARYFLALALIGQFEFAHAEKELLQVRRVKSGEGQASGASLSLYAAKADLELGRLHFLLGPTHYEKAKAILDNAVKMDANLVVARLLLADLYLNYLPGDKIANARMARQIIEEGLKKTLLRKNERKDLMTALAFALRGEQRPAEAVQTMKQAHESDETDRNMQFNLGLLYLAAGDKRQAFARLNPLADFWNQRPLLFSYYYAQSLDNDPASIERSIKLFREVNEKLRDDPQSVIGLASTLLVAGEPKEAEKVLAQASFNDVFYLKTHHWRPRLVGGLFAGFAMEEPDVSSLLKYQAESLRRNGFSVEGMTAYAYLATLAGQRASALKFVEGALNQDPQDAAANHLYAQLLRAEGKNARVVELMRSALRNEVRTPMVLLLLGEGYLGSGNFPLAKQHLENLINEGKFQSRAHYALGQVYLETKNPTEARAHWIQALQLDPTYILPKLALYNSGW